LFTEHNWLSSEILLRLQDSTNTPLATKRLEWKFAM